MFQFRARTLKNEEEYQDIPTSFEGFAAGIGMFYQTSCFFAFTTAVRI
ncbi:MAG: hypothetical protein QG581_191 [Patescibacteria group bacterium]|jgi:hypothetical protein|nr:hypothetical protein [Patescibacteria group bacterium]